MTASETIKVLIADDELLVRQGLMKMIDWSGYGMEVVADAANGEAAWKKYNELHPQVIITDIVMPRMDGLELAQKVKASDPKAKVLFLSCHGDFAYAQEGLRLGASGYILKTEFNEAEIDMFLARIQTELHGADTGGRTEEDGFMADDRLSVALRDWAAQKPVELLSLMKEAVKRKWRFLESASSVLHVYSAEQSTQLSELLGGIEHQQQAALVPIRDGHWFVLCDRLLFPVIADQLTQARRNGCDVGWSCRDGIAGAAQCVDAFNLLYKQWLYQTGYGIDLRENPELVVMAIDYTLEHLAEPISVAHVADYVGLSRSYFSVLFKKSVGDSFLGFLYKIRLERAKSLLRSTDWRLQDIAEKVGMPDAKYFSKWFRKTAASTPTEYRERTKERHI